MDASSVAIGVMLHTPCDFAGDSTRKLAEAAGELAAVAATGVLVAATAQNLAQDQESYVTPATDVPGSIVLQDPVGYANGVQVTGTPLDSGDLPTILPPMQPVGITTQQLVTPLPVQQAGSNIYQSRKYVPSPKHVRGGWGTRMDLSDATAQNVLDSGIEDGKQVYGYFNGKLYEFMPDNVDGFHGYPVPGNQVPTAVLRTMRELGLITNAQYNKFVQGK